MKYLIRKTECFTLQRRFSTYYYHCLSALVIPVCYEIKLLGFCLQFASPLFDNGYRWLLAQNYGFVLEPLAN